MPHSDVLHAASTGVPPCLGVKMRYPVAGPQDWKTVGRLSPIGRVWTSLKDKRYRRKANDVGHITLTEVKRASPEPEQGDIIAVCVVRNGGKYLPSFLAHYRKIGITRFAFVDDLSDDDTRSLLLEAPDVDIYESNVRYGESGRGTAWKDMLFSLYGKNRWYVSVDCDEYLVYPGYEERPVASFIRDLESHGRRRALAAMIDIYPEGPIGNSPPHLPPEAPPTRFSPMHDGDGYRLGNEKFCMAVRGGPRFRLFGADMRLTKFPVLFVDRKTQFNGASNHAPLPFRRNFSPVHAVLLHYKFPSDSVREFQKIASSGNHAGGSHFYKMIVNHDDFHPETVLRYPGSRIFESSEAMVAGGFMQDLREPG